jgi:alcohol dehydrogenase
MAAGNWEYRNPTRVVVGPGASSELGARPLGRALLVTSSGATRRGLTERVTGLLDPGSVLVHDRVEPNPTVERLDASITALRGTPIDAIVAVGGGSVIDTAKILGLALATDDAGVRDLVDGAMPSGAEPVPLVAVPTTAGTGSEVTPFATVWDARAVRKLSVADPRLFPTLALVDATLTLELGWEHTLSSGLDAYVQCLEAICNRNANPVTTAFAERGLAAIPPALRTLRREPGSSEARASMAEGALLSGLAISHTRTALAHSMSYPITAHFGVPHGIACALVLPAVLEFNLEADDGRLAAVARRAGLHDPGELLREVVALFRELGVAELAAPYLPGFDALDALADEMLTPARSDNNLRVAVEADVRALLERTDDLIGARRS